jgi:hypothetical protein
VKPKKPVTYDTVRRLALALPDVEEGTSYGPPALKVKGKLFVRLRDDIDSIVLRMSFDKRDELMGLDPETFYITDHYVKHQWILVRLSNVPREALPALLQIGYREALPAKRSRRS